MTPATAAAIGESFCRLSRKPAIDSAQAANAIA
jgi:hypothetical protein